MSHQLMRACWKQARRIHEPNQGKHTEGQFPVARFLCGACVHKWAAATSSSP